MHIFKKNYNHVFSIIFKNSIIVKSKKGLALLLVSIFMFTFVLANAQVAHGFEEPVEEENQEDVVLPQEEAWQVVEEPAPLEPNPEEEVTIHSDSTIEPEADGGLNSEALPPDSKERELEEEEEPNKEEKGLVIGPLSFIISSTSGLIPQVGDVATGAVFIGDYWMEGGIYFFNVSNFTGDLVGAEALAPMICLDPSASNPSRVTSEYRAIVTEVNLILGYVDYQVVITPPNATTGELGENGLPLGFQRVGGMVRVHRSFTGSLEIFKHCSNPGISEGNPLYSIVGAEYGLYNMEDQLIRVIMIDEQGMGRADDLPIGDYYLKELKPPKAYALDETIYHVTILFDEVISVDVYNAPIHHPIGLIVEKYDSETGTNVPSGNASLAGAQFTIRYFDGFYAYNPMNQGINPTRTWVMETDERGQIYLNDQYKVSGDPFYYASDGRVTLPIGTVTIQETKAPVGYLLNERVIINQINDKGYEEIIQTFSKVRVSQEIIRGDVEIFKFVEEEEGIKKPLKGISFTFTSRSTGEAFTIVTDEYGYASTKQLGISNRGNLVYDTYVVTEAHDYLEYGIISPFEVVISSEGEVLYYSIKNDLKEIKVVVEEEPERPSVPEKPKPPANPEDPENPRGITAPQTGDIKDTRVLIQSLVLLLSVAVLLITIKRSRILGEDDEG